MKGHFISFEGPDGAGKTSVLKALISELQPRLGNRLVVTREPGGDPLSEQLRRVLFDDRNKEMDDRTEALLFAAARCQHVVSVLEPALAAGKIIFSDRYVDSSVAYQGGGRQLGEQAVWDINAFATQGVMPELTLYFDVPSEVGIRRIAEHRQNQVNRLDREALTFHHRVRHAYLHLLEQYPDRIKKIDATQPLTKVIADARQLLNRVEPGLFDGH